MTDNILTLRAPEPSDIDLLYQWENDFSLWHLSNTITPFSRYTIEQYILNAGTDIFTAKQLRLMIELKDKTIVGCIDLFDFDPSHHRAGIGLMIHEQFRNKKYASHALDLMISYSFNTLRLHQLYCNILADNDPSIHLFQKFHFKMIGLKKDWVQLNNQWKDEYMFQLINHSADRHH